eukprot:jgi/Mesvir1/22037/Mv12269-RA.1
MPSLATRLKGKLRHDPMLLSIVAGYPMGKFEAAFGASSIVRAMPNTPAMIQEAITVWTCSRDMPKERRAAASMLLGAFGDEVYVEDEKFLDMATALSGSGPAYIFLVMEAMVDAAVHMGFPRSLGQRLVLQTIYGSSKLAMAKNNHLAELRNDITSPGGTTASAIYFLEKGCFRTVVSDAVWAAYRRALELGGNNSNVGPGRNELSLPDWWWESSNNEHDSARNKKNMDDGSG